MTGPTTCAPTHAVVSAKMIRAQLWRDLYDKEVQSAATYSYLWIADQMGHVGLGLIVVFALTWSTSWKLGRPPESLWPLMVGVVAVSLWELSAFRTYAKKWTHLFPSNAPMLVKNALAAALYMIIGVAVGYAWLLPDARASAAATFAGALFAIALAPDWLRQKIIWQKAGIPYLFRLSDARVAITKDAADRMRGILDQLATWVRDENPYPDRPPIVVLTGRLGAGKTTLACGIATEAAFSGAKVRYTTFDKLAQMAATDTDDAGPPNIVYWPWKESEFLAIDDIDPGGGYLTLAEFTDILAREFRDNRLCLGRRATVWVLPEKTDDDLNTWIAAIRAQLGDQPDDPRQVLVVELRSPTTPD